MSRKSRTKIPPQAQTSRDKPTHSQETATHQAPSTSLNNAEALEDIDLSYHRQTIRQTEVLYWIYVILCFGLSIWISYAVLNFSIDRIDAWLRITPSVLLIPFAREVSKAWLRTSQAHDKLRADRERQQAIEMVESVENQELKGILQAISTMEAIGVSISSAEFSSMLGALLKVQLNELVERKKSD